MLTQKYGVDPLRRVSRGVKPKDCQISFENVVLAPLGRALMMAMKKKK
jgi:hypothetical protein